MTFIRRLMEIKEEQRCAETRQELYLTSIDTTLKQILEELKGKPTGMHPFGRCDFGCMLCEHIPIKELKRRKKDGKSNKVR